MPLYETREFHKEDEIRVPEDYEVVDTFPGSRSHLRTALVRVPPHAEGVAEDDENALCGYNGCQRTVSDPDDRCWQHEDEE